MVKAIRSKLTILNLVLILALVLSYIPVLIWTSSPAKGAGTSQEVLNSTYLTCARLGHTEYQATWLELTDELEADSVVSGAQISAKIWSDSDTDEYDGLERGFLKWDISSFDFADDEVEIDSIVIDATVLTEVDTLSNITKYGFVTVDYADVGTSWDVTDYAEFNYHALQTTWLSEDDYGTEAVQWTLDKFDDYGMDELIDYDNGYLYMAFVSYCDGQVSFPTWSSDHADQWIIQGTSLSMTVNYVGAPEDRDGMVIEGNAAVDTTTDGSEEATALDWITPRCAYADENIGFLVTGDSGASISLKLYDGAGYVLESHTDSIRTDGYYRWNVSLPDNEEGYLHCVEENFNLECEWGYIMPLPDGDMGINEIQAVDTDTPQYFENWPNYRATEKKVQYIHYKTNLEDTDFTDFSLRIWYLGDSGEEVYNDTLDDICDDYFLHTETDNDEFCQWRYMLFSFNGDATGLDDKDGLIYDLDVDYSWETCGFYQPLIYEDGVGEFTTTNSGYWYNKYDTDGIQLSINEWDYFVGEKFDITIQTGEKCQVLEELAEVEMDLYNSSHELVYAYDDFTLTDSIYNTGEQVLPLLSGDWYILLTFTGDSSFNYKQAINVHIASTGGEDGESGRDSWFNALGWAGDSLDNLGLGGSGGHWFLLIVGMAGSFIIFRKSNFLRLVFPVAIFGLFLAMGWIETWVVILLAMAAGLFLFVAIFRGKQGGE